jgi:hypothetical protein
MVGKRKRWEGICHVLWMGYHEGFGDGELGVYRIGLRFCRFRASGFVTSRL